MIDILLIAVAAVCKSVADTLDHHFDTSVFRDKPRKFWDPNVIVKTMPQIFGYPLDAWHLINSLQIAAWLFLPFFYHSHLPKEWMDYLAGGGIFIIVFGIFYNKVWR